jgi:hypothetical protein
MITAIIAVLFIAATAAILVLVHARRRPKSAMAVAQELASAPKADFPAMKRAAESAVLLATSTLAGERLARAAWAALAPVEGDRLKAGLEQQLRSVQEGLAELERRVGTYSAAGSRLAAVAASPDGRHAVPSASALGPAFAELASLPEADIDPDSLAHAVASLQAANPSLAGTPSTTHQAAPENPGIAKRLSAALRPADPHAEAKAALLADMARLGLDTEWRDLPGWSAYAQLTSGYDASLAETARSLAEKISAARDREASELETAIRSALLGQGRPDEVERLTRELRVAAEKYASQLQAVLTSAAEEFAGRHASPVDDAALGWRLDALPDLLGRCEEHLGRGEAAEALNVLAAAGLPAVPSWAASRQYQATWERIAGQLHDLADQRSLNMACGAGGAVGHLQGRLSHLSAAVETAVTTWRHQENTVWTALVSAAETVKRSAAMALRDPVTSRDAAEPVRAAAALLCLDDVAARNLGNVITNAIPEPAAATDSENVDDQLSVTDQLLKALDRNAAVLSGIDGMIIPVLSAADSGLGAGLAAGIAQLAPVPAELSQALQDVVGFIHHPLAGMTPDGMMEGFIHYVEQSIVPGVGTLFAAEDEPLAAFDIAKFLGKGIGSSYLHEAAATPLIQNGQQQLDLVTHQAAHAAGLAAPDLLHGVIGHVPFVTLALSTTREIRLYRDDKTTWDQAIVNIAIDTGGVFAGITGAELAVHFIAGAHPAGIITIPAGIAGSIIARAFIKKHRQRPYKEALDKYSELTSTFSVKALELATALSETARTTIGRERRIYLASIGVPTLAQQTAKNELDALITSLRAATVTYSRTVLDLMATGTAASAGSDPDDEAGSSDAVRAAKKITGAVKQSDTQARSGQYAPALLTLTKPALPAPDAWRPGREYRELCQQTAARISELTERNRADVARWATGATAKFKKRNEAIGAIVSAKSHSIQLECTEARQAIEAAAKTVQREADALGLKQKQRCVAR